MAVKKRLTVVADSQEEIVAEHMRTPVEWRVVGIGVGWATIDGQVTGFGESGKESRVVVSVLTEHADEYRDRFRKKYGDMVYVEAQDGYNTVSIHRDMGFQNPVKSVHLLLLIVVLCVPTAWVLHRKRTTAVKSADNP